MWPLRGNGKTRPGAPTAASNDLIHDGPHLPWWRAQSDFWTCCVAAQIVWTTRLLWVLRTNGTQYGVPEPTPALRWPARHLHRLADSRLYILMCTCGMMSTAAPRHHACLADVQRQCSIEAGAESHPDCEQHQPDQEKQAEDGGRTQRVLVRDARACGTHRNSSKWFRLLHRYTGTDILRTGPTVQRGLYTCA